MPGNWPDPARPGVPANPERDGWHWLAFDRYEGPVIWRSAYQFFRSSQDARLRPIDVAHWRYLGPCRTPAEIAALVAAAYQRGQRDALEAAAVRAEAEPAYPNATMPAYLEQLVRENPVIGIQAASEDTSRCIAAALRAMVEQESPDE